jgi:hypothetical protein
MKAAVTLLRNIRPMTASNTTPNPMIMKAYGLSELTKNAKGMPTASAKTPAITIGVLKDPMTFSIGSRKLNRVREAADSI